MSRTDRRRPRRQVVTWKPDDYRIELMQLGHEVWRLTEHDGINVVNVEDFVDPDTAQQRFVEVQGRYLEAIAAQTLHPLPKTPSEVLSITDERV